MKTYIAAVNKNRFCGGWRQCLNWAVELVTEDQTRIAKIHYVRAGEKNARIVAEIAADSIRVIHSGRYIPVRKLRGAIDG